MAAVQVRTDPSPLTGGMRGSLITIGRLENAPPGSDDFATMLSLASHERKHYELIRQTHGISQGGKGHQLEIIASGNQIQAMAAFGKSR